MWHKEATGSTGTRPGAAGLSEVYRAPKLVLGIDRPSGPLQVAGATQGQDCSLQPRRCTWTRYATADQMGRLKCGRLRLEGLLRPVELRPFDPNDPTLLMGWGHDRA